MNHQTEPSLDAFWAQPTDDDEPETFEQTDQLAARTCQCAERLAEAVWKPRPLTLPSLADAAWKPGPLTLPSPDPLERIANAVEALLGMARPNAEYATDLDDKLREMADDYGRMKEKNQGLHEIVADLEDNAVAMLRVIEGVEKALGKSTARPAVAARAVIDQWRNPATEEEEAAEELAPDVEPAPDGGGYPIDPPAEVVEESTEPLQSVPTWEGVRPELPAHDAPVEAWRSYAKAVGAAGPDIDSMNRSQIRTALGVAQPVAQGGSEQ